jgi:hypothetical protein
MGKTKRALFAGRTGPVNSAGRPCLHPCAEWVATMGVLAEGSTVSQYLYGLGFAGLFLTTAMLLRTLAQIQSRGRPQ